MKRLVAGALASMMVLAGASAALAQAKPPLKLGLILDMSGPYADITGPGSVVAGQMAAEDFGGEVLGRKIEMHMPSDRPGMIMRKQINDLLAAHGEVEIPR